MFVGLVKDPGRDWRPPDDGPDPESRRWLWGQWRAFTRIAIWVAVLSGLFALVPVVDHVLGHLAAYMLILLTVALGVWRGDRWLGHQYWEGLREYKQ
jgi:hypothetical protein